MCIVLFFVVFGGSLWPRASDQVLVDLEGGREAILGLTAIDGNYPFYITTK